MVSYYYPPERLVELADDILDEAEEEDRGLGQPKPSDNDTQPEPRVEGNEASLRTAVSQEPATEKQQEVARTGSNDERRIRSSRSNEPVTHSFAVRARGQRPRRQPADVVRLESSPIIEHRQRRGATTPASTSLSLKSRIQRTHVSKDEDYAQHFVNGCQSTNSSDYAV